MKYARLLSCLLALVASSAGHAKPPKVVASIKPLHSLVASVMQGVGETHLLVKGAASPHDYAMTPSDAAALQEADLIFWIGPELEAFLHKPVAALGAHARVVTLEDIEGLTKHATREGGAFEAHDDGHADENVANDPHIWLDPANAKLMVRRIEQALSQTYPANGPAFKTNALKTAAKLDVLETEIAATLAPIKGRRFFTFHDAFQYFEKRFGVEASGSVGVNPDAAHGAARVAQLQAKMKQLGVNCVFAEPNFQPNIIRAVIEGSDAKVGTLDPEASRLTEGPELYFQSLRGIALAMAQCLRR